MVARLFPYCHNIIKAIGLQDKIYKEKNLSVRDLELFIKNDNKKEKKLNILVDEDNLTINLKFENSEDLHRFLKKINK